MDDFSDVWLLIMHSSLKETIFMFYVQVLFWEKQINKQTTKTATKYLIVHLKRIELVVENNLYFKITSLPRKVQTEKTEALKTLFLPTH